MNLCQSTKKVCCLMVCNSVRDFSWTWMFKQFSLVLNLQGTVWTGHLVPKKVSRQLELWTPDREHSLVTAELSNKHRLLQLIITVAKTLVQSEEEVSCQLDVI